MYKVNTQTLAILALHPKMNKLFDIIHETEQKIDEVEVKRCLLIFEVIYNNLCNLVPTWRFPIPSSYMEIFLVLDKVIIA